MTRKLTNGKLHRLFEELEREDRLVFACGPEGVSANLVGRFHVRRHGAEDVLDVDDGTHHAHVDWGRVTRVGHADFHGEGLLVFSEGERPLFRIYRPAGALRRRPSLAPRARGLGAPGGGSS